MAMTVSEITINVLKDWLGVSDGDETALNACLTAAKSRAVGYTGLTLAELDEHEDLTTSTQTTAPTLHKSPSIPCQKTF